MNEIITKLNEIEEKAQTILCDARENKTQMRLQLEQDKRDIDAEYDRLEAEMLGQLKERLKSEAKAQIEELQEKNRCTAESFDAEFAKHKEMWANQIMMRVIQ